MILSGRLRQGRAGLGRATLGGENGVKTISILGILRVNVNTGFIFVLWIIE